MRIHYNLLVLIFIFFTNQIVAQNPQIIVADTQITSQNYTQELSFYFETGSAELPSNKEVKMILQEFTPKADFGKKDSIFLQAFTDDRGSQSTNQSLAFKRSLVIQKRLLELGIPSHKIIIQQPILLTNADNASEEIRKEFRKVNITWKKVEEIRNIRTQIIEKQAANIPPKEEAPNAAIALMQELIPTQVEQFELNPNEGTWIKTAKGTQLQIPAQSFVDVQGNLISNPVELSIQEAYSTQDFIGQNLQTSSNGQLIETGGMLRIEAKTKTGENLQLADNKQITAVMASDEAKLEGMQTFEGVESGVDNAVNWIPTQRIVQTNDNRLVGKGESNVYVYKKSTIKSASQLDFHIPDFKYKLPRHQNKPSLGQQAPKRPKLKANPKPSREDLRINFPQQNKENDIAYRKRINKKYKIQYKKYWKRRKASYAIHGKYKRDSANYARAHKKYIRSANQYALYQSQLRSALEELEQKATEVDFETYNNSLVELYEGFADINNRCNDLRKIYTKIQSEKERMSINVPEIDSLVNRIDQLHVDKKLAPISNHIDNIFRMYRYKTRKDAEQYNTDQIACKNLTKKIAHFMRSLPQNDSLLQPKQLDKIRNYCHTMNDKFQLKNISSIYQTNKNTLRARRSYIEDFSLIETAIATLQKEWLNYKEKNGLLSTAEISAMYGSALSIDKMGWINCDRFLMIKHQK